MRLYKSIQLLRLKGRLTKILNLMAVPPAPFVKWEGFFFFKGTFYGIC